MKATRDESIRFRVSRQERQAILLAALRVGKSLSEYMRTTALEKADQVECVVRAQATVSPSVLELLSEVNRDR